MPIALEPLLRAKFGEVRRSRGKNGLEYRVRCHFSGCSDTKFKLYINPGKGVYNCYKCGKAGTLSEIIDWSPGDEVAPTINLENYRKLKSVDPPGEMVSLKVLQESHPAIRYLTHTRKRTFDPVELSDVFGVQYCYRGRQFRLGNNCIFDTTNTIVFPIWMFGEPVGWQARLLYEPKELSSSECETLHIPKDDDGEYILPPKYMTSPGMSKGRVLYNFDTARRCAVLDKEGKRCVAVGEGPFDSASIGAASVGTLGKGISDVQARLLATYWEKVFLLLDPGDADAETAALAGRLRLSVEVIPINLVGHKDPGDAARENIWEQVTTADQAYQAMKRLAFHGQEN